MPERFLSPHVVQNEGISRVATNLSESGDEAETLPTA